MYVLTILNTLLIIVAFAVIITMARTLTLVCRRFEELYRALSSDDMSEEDYPTCDQNTTKEELVLTEICTTGPNGENLDLLEDAIEKILNRKETSKH